LFLNEPPNYLFAIKNEPPGTARSEMWQALPKALLPDGPDRTANQRRDLPNPEGITQQWKL
jgi:hypothetical protein